MAYSIRDRMQERLADRVRWVQYPRQSYIPRGQEHPVSWLPQFKYQMPLWRRIFIIQMGLVVTLAGLALLALGLFAAYMFIWVVTL